MSLSSTVQASDLTTCDQEPIHAPGSIQPHGVLLVLDSASGSILQASTNLKSCFGVDAESVLKGTLRDVLGHVLSETLNADLERSDLTSTPVYLRTIRSAYEQSPFSGYNSLAHKNKDGLTILEFEGSLVRNDTELFRDFYPLVTAFVSELQGVRSVASLADLAAREVRRITGYDRVLIYAFDPDWNGEVIAESRNEKLPSYMEHRFPAADIPSQARELYRLNRMRLIVSSDYEPVPILASRTQNIDQLLDLSFSVLRSVSPIHLEYMRNMETASSMSVSIIRDGKLWGLISCHHHTPRHVSYDIRVACDFLAQVLSVQLDAQQHNEEFAERIRLKSIESRLLAYMAREENFVDGLMRAPDDLLTFGSAHGAAVLHDGDCRFVGMTPSEIDVRQLVDWLADRGDQEITHTDRLASIFPPAADYEAVASGLLAVRISKLYRSYLLWFRPEVIQTIKWGGQPPEKPPLGSFDGIRLHPRKSFETWCETVRGRSLPWSKSQVEAAAELRNSVVGIVLRKAEELAEITGELERSNRELEAFSYSVSHDLRAPFRHIVGFAELLREQEAPRLSETGQRYTRTIIESAQYAGTLVDSLLNFSRIGRTAMNFVSINMNELLQEVVAELKAEQPERNITWKISRLGAVHADPVMMRLVWRNLLSNAIKYSRQRDPAVIEIGSEIGPTGETRFWIRDNGVGFDMKYANKLFGVFQRLHRMEDFEGTGIGLANVRRIVSRHRGKTWAEGAIDRGSTFYFTLPPPGENEA